MKFTFKNLGPIKKAEFEQGDLTVIAGGNNTGKTYLTYAFYGFWMYINNFIRADEIHEDMPSRHLLSYLRHVDERTGFSRLMRPRRNENTEEGMKINIKASDDVVSACMDICDIQKFIEDRFTKLCGSYSRKVGGDLGSGNKLFDKTSMNISFPVPLKMSCSDIFDYFKVEFGTKDIHIKYTGEFDDSVNFEKIFRGFVFVWFVKEKMPIPFILSAERFGISLFYRELDFNKNSIIELLQTMENENRDGDIPYMAINRYAAKYAKPVKDNISFTRSLPDMSSEMMESKLNSGIENMMKGKYISEKNGVFFISKDDKFKIPLHMASSSARGLSDLYFYHGHVDRKTGQTLIIDEPESHLDTRNQILMARALARCVNAGVRVLITTHSDYIIKELNNLIMLSHDFPGKDKFLKEFKEDYDSNDYLCKDKVRAYVCREGRLDACEIDSRGMMMPLFDDVIYDINLISDTLDEYHGEEDQK